MVRHKDKTKDQSQSSHCPKTFERPSGSVETIVQDTLQERQAHWQQNVKKRAVAQGFCTALYSTEYNIITLNRKMLGPNQPAMDVKVWSQCTGRRRKLISTIKLQIYIFSQSCFYLTWTKSGMFSIPSCGDMIFFFFLKFFCQNKKEGKWERWGHQRGGTRAKGSALLPVWGHGACTARLPWISSPQTKSCRSTRSAQKKAYFFPFEVVYENEYLSGWCFRFA